MTPEIEFLIRDELVISINDMLEESFILLKKRGLINLSHIVKKILVTYYDEKVHMKNQLAVYSNVNKWIYLIIHPDDTRYDFNNNFREYVNIFIHEVGHAIEVNLKPQARKEWSEVWQPYEKFMFKNDKIFYSSLLRRLYSVRGNISKFEFVDDKDYLKVASLLFPYLDLDLDDWKKQVADKKPLVWKDLANPIRSYFSNPEEMQMPREIDKILADENIQGFLIDEYYYGRNPYQDLNLPSRSHSNSAEDFAETFRLYLLEPKKLSEVSLYRLLNALWLSHFLADGILEYYNFIAKD